MIAATTDPKLYTLYSFHSLHLRIYKQLKNFLQFSSVLNELNVQ